MKKINSLKKSIRSNKFFILANILILIFLFSSAWKFYPIYGSDLFIDWLYIFDFKNCKNNTLITPENLCTNILASEFVYPKVWLILSKITDNRSNFQFLILPLIFMYTYIVDYIIQNENIIIKILFLSSSASVLLLQRGNNDLIIFAFIFLFFITMENKKYNFFLVPLVVAIKAKIYPIALFPILILKKNIKNKKKYYLILAILFFIMLIFSDYFELNQNYNKSGSVLAFSSSMIFKIIIFLTNIKFNYTLVSLFILFFIITISFFTKINLPSIQNSKEISFLIGSAIIVSGFFLNEGYIYKLVFTIFTFPLILEYKKFISYKLYSYLLFTTLIALWAEFLTFGVENLLDINHFHPKEYPGYNFNNIVYGISIILKNLIYWALNVNLIFISTKIFIKKIKN